LDIAPTAQKRGIKNLLCIPPLAERKKLDIPHLRDELLRNFEPPPACQKSRLGLVGRMADCGGKSAQNPPSARAKRARTFFRKLPMSNLVAITERSANLL